LVGVIEGGTSIMRPSIFSGALIVVLIGLSFVVAGCYCI
jgi:hypothetical protein